MAAGTGRLRGRASGRGRQTPAPPLVRSLPGWWKEEGASQSIPSQAGAEDAAGEGGVPQPHPPPGPPPAAEDIPRFRVALFGRGKPGIQPAQFLRGFSQDRQQQQLLLRYRRGILPYPPGLSAHPAPWPPRVAVTPGCSTCVSGLS